MKKGRQPEEVGTISLRSPDLTLQPVAGLPPATNAPATSCERNVFHVPPLLIALGASTGGPPALEEILCHMPPDLPAAMLIVQHMPAGFTASLARRLDGLCQVSVREAAHDEMIEPGVAYIAPAGMHLTVRRCTASKAAARLSNVPVGMSHIPSIDVMMSSVAEVFGVHSMGVILTGMGSDGAQGMQAILQAGGMTLGQNEGSCVVYGMPRVCADMGILQRVAPLPEIPRYILQATRYRPRV